MTGWLFYSPIIMCLALGLPVLAAKVGSEKLLRREITEPQAWGILFGLVFVGIWISGIWLAP